LAHVDKLAEHLAGMLPAGVTMHVTGDHGMVDVPLAEKIDVDAVPGLRDGEPRARHVYTEPGATDDVLAAWREVLGGRAWVASREEAAAHGWFGPTDPLFLERIGDVVAAPAD